MSVRREFKSDEPEKAINYTTLRELSDKIERQIRQIEDRINELSELHKSISGTISSPNTIRYRTIELGGKIGQGFPVLVMDSNPDSYAFYVQESLNFYRLEHKKLTIIRDEVNALLKMNMGDINVMYLSMSGVPSRIVIFPRTRLDERKSGP
ncbi:MAG: hypothetical protein AT710_06835 [Thermocladium sp. ECH_B]|nr:MAG: hypothetical protein AT710_06835 [Thermocladium sp. ECH_B]